jgi:hypothetical protein
MTVRMKSGGSRGLPRAGIAQEKHSLPTKQDPTRVQRQPSSLPKKERHHAAPQRQSNTGGIRPWREVHYDFTAPLHVKPADQIVNGYLFVHAGKGLRSGHASEADDDFGLGVSRRKTR